MGWVMTVMVSFSDEELWEDEETYRDNCPSLDNINAWLQSSKDEYGPLTDLVPCAKGNAVGMSANLYGGGFKHFDDEGFFEIVKSQDWNDPDNLQVFLKDEEDQKFTVYEYNDL